MSADFGPHAAALYRRDLTRLLQELEAFPDEATLWRTAPGIENSAGNLALHLEGNLREYIGWQLGGIPYERDRGREFSQKGLSAADLRGRVQSLMDTIPDVIARITRDDLDRVFPDVVDAPLSTVQLVAHLLGHLNFHLGQIGYLRRVLTGNGAIPFAGLSS